MDRTAERKPLAQYSRTYVRYLPSHLPSGVHKSQAARSAALRPASCVLTPLPSRLWLTTLWLTTPAAAPPPSAPPRPHGAPPSARLRGALPRGLPQRSLVPQPRCGHPTAGCGARSARQPATGRGKNGGQGAVQGSPGKQAAGLAHAS
eukprot:74700-Chlamydomonas_euryale.AAC.1